MSSGALPDSGFKKWFPLMITSLAFMIIILDTTILNVSLRTIILDLGTTIQSIQWVITAYSLTLAALTITGGRLGDFFGRKKMFVIGAIIFAIGSFITSISHSVGEMIIGEAIIEGIGAALMMPATSALLVSNYKGRDRQLAMGVWGGIAGGASALGPVLGGWLTTSFSWRWAFRINVFVAALLLIGSFFLKESVQREKSRKLDYIGILLSAFGLLSLVFGFIEASTYGWFTAKTPFVVAGYILPLGTLSIVPISIGLGAFILMLFLWWESVYQKNGNVPLVSLKLLKNKQFTMSALIMTIVSLSQAGMSFSMPVFLQSVLGVDALHTGLAMLPMSLTLLIMGPFSGYITKFFTSKRIIQVGLIVYSIAFLVMHFSITDHANQWSIAPGFMLFGLGMGLMMAQISNMTLSAVPIEEIGEASGVNNTLRQVGFTLGSAMMGAILLSTLSAGLASGLEASTIIPAESKPAIIQTVTSQTSAIEFGGVLETSGALMTVPIRHEIKALSHEATITGNRKVLLFGVFFSLLAFALSFKLPNTKNVERGSSSVATH